MEGLALGNWEGCLGGTSEKEKQYHRCWGRILGLCSKMEKISTGWPTGSPEPREFKGIKGLTGTERLKRVLFLVPREKRELVVFTVLMTRCWGNGEKGSHPPWP